MNDPKYIDPRYRIMELNEDELKIELSKWNRQDLINWLQWNDRNGIYRDEYALAEVGRIMTYEEGVEIMIRQIIQNE